MSFPIPTLRLALWMALATGLPLAVVPATAAHQANASETAAPAMSAPIADPALVERTNFGLVLLMGDLDADDQWQSVLRARRERIATAIRACTDAPCRIRAFRWTEAEVAHGATRLAKAPGLATRLRATGAFARYHDQSDAQLVERAWRDLTAAHDHVLDIYGLGTPPRYPVIDSISFDATSDLLSKLIIEATNLILAEAKVAKVRLRTDPGHQLALTLLQLNDRENAGFFSDLDRRWNAAARARVKTIDWSRWPHTLILVLGDGPDRAGQAVGSFGKLRLAHAVSLYRAGLAPFIVVSGGNVHPANTPLNEALEMKRMLMQRHAIPDHAIIMEPHARHTTTNFRNTARLMLRYGIPLERTALATTSEGHSVYAGSAAFDQKAMDEIAMVPRRVVRRLSPYDFAFLANPASTHRDARDPLDP